MIRRTKFGDYPPALQSLPSTEASIAIDNPTLGFDGGAAPTKLAPGYTPRSANWVVDDDSLTVRSGLSTFGSNVLLGPALGGGEVFDLDGARHALTMSHHSLAYLPSFTSAEWRVLSYQTASSSSTTGGTIVNQTLNNSDFDFWQHTYIYDAGTDLNAAITTAHNRDYPSFFYIRDSTTTYSSFTFFNSIASNAASVAAFDDRLVWFNTISSDGTFPTRVLWSPRGQPFNYTVSQGAGFQDLFDMSGRGTRVVAERDGILLFSDREIWRGRKRQDAYVFDFSALAKKLGCPFPKTIVSTPFGVIFLASDFEVYLINGVSITQLGPATEGEHSRVQSYLRRTVKDSQRLWALYNAQMKRYELYVPTAVGAWPTEALFYALQNTSYLRQTFPYGLTYGFEAFDRDAAPTWGDMEAPWGEVHVTWGDLKLSNVSESIMVFSSRGTCQRFSSTQTTDDGQMIEARWQTNAVAGSKPSRFDHAYEVWMDYANRSASSLSLFISEDRGASFLQGYPVNLSASSGSYQMIPVDFNAQAPLMEIRVNDGGKPRLHSFDISLRDDGLWGGRG